MVICLVIARHFKNLGSLTLNSLAHVRLLEDPIGVFFIFRDEVKKMAKDIKELATELTIAWVEAWKMSPRNQDDVCQAYEKFYNKILEIQRKS